MRTPVAKRIKTLAMFNNLTGVGVDTIEKTEQLMFDEDVRLLGFSMGLQWACGALPALQEGAIDGMLYLLRAPGLGITGSNKFLGFCAVHPSYWTEIVVAQQCAGTFSNGPGFQNCMFPEGYGVDFDENEYLYLVNKGGQSMQVDTMVLTGWAILYYVER